MTKAEWLKCTDPEPMLAFLRGKTSDRKLRLFACACFRRIWHLLSDERSRKAVEVLEQFAEGVASAEELAVARSSAEAAAEDASDAVSAADALYSEDRSTADAYAAAEAVRSATDAPSFVFEGVPRFANAVAYVACAAGCEAEAAAYASGNDDQTAKVAEKAARAAEEVAQANLLRHLIGNPFRRVRIAPAWLVWNNGTIPKLARAMYEDQAFNRLPILADALEDAGCSNAEILDHCRGPGPHVRGCWVMDAILGKE